MTTNVEKLAAFAAHTRFEDLPPLVLEESRRLLVDTLGCALGGWSHPKGTIGVDYARLQGPGAPGAQATIIGSRERVSTVAAAFANGELINALDYDAVLPPGHVSPYVMPGALAEAEAVGASGRELLCAVAIAHEISNRIGKALDYLRDVKDGRISPPPVNGYASTIFGATAAIGRIKGHSAATIIEALGIAGSVAPVNAQWSWSVHSPTATIKYAVAGALTQAAQMASTLAQLGHTGDRQTLDDGEHGFRRMIGSARWVPERITPGLGQDWFFPAELSFKPYPHCRILHGPLDALNDVLTRHDIRVDEIEQIKAWVEGFVMQPLWLNRRIEHVTQAQFSIAHGLSVGAHRVPVGKRWQSPEVVFDPSVIALMDRIVFEVHPDYERLLTGNAASRPTRIEVRARGQTFVGERRYPRGSPSPDPTTRLSNDEISAKFLGNADGVLTAQQAQRALQALWEADTQADVGSLMPLLAP